MNTQHFTLFLIDKYLSPIQSSRHLVLTITIFWSFLQFVAFLPSAAAEVHCTHQINVKLIVHFLLPELSDLTMTPFLENSEIISKINRAQSCFPQCNTPVWYKLSLVKCRSNFQNFLLQIFGFTILKSSRFSLTNPTTDRFRTEIKALSLLGRKGKLLRHFHNIISSDERPRGILGLPPYNSPFGKLSHS